MRSTTPSPSPRLSRRACLGGMAALSGGVALSACGGSGEAAPDGISAMLPLFATTAPDPASDYQKSIEEFLGEALPVTWVSAADYPDRATVTMASDDIPTFMVQMSKDSAFVQSAQAGAYWDLTDVLQDYPNLIASDEAILQGASVNGSQYGLFRWRDPMRSSVAVRADWLDELGLETPRSVDELREVAEAFASEKPGGDLTSALLLSQWGTRYGGDGPYDYFATWFGAPNGWGERDGSLVPAFDTEEFEESLSYLRSMLEDGLLNADFPVLTTSDIDDAFLQGKGGILVGTDDVLESMAGKFDQLDPGNGASYITLCGNLAGPDGQLHGHPTPGFNGLVVIPRQSVVDEDQLASLLGLLDKANSPEGQTLLSIGTEGVNFEMDGEFYVPIEGAEVGENGGTSPFQNMISAPGGSVVPARKPASDELAAALEERDELRSQALEVAVHDAAAGLVSEAEITEGEVLNQIIGDARVKYIAGEIDLQRFRDEVARWHASGGDAIVEEINQLHQG